MKNKPTWDRIFLLTLRIGNWFDRRKPRPRVTYSAEVNQKVYTTTPEGYDPTKPPDWSFLKNSGMDKKLEKW